VAQEKKLKVIPLKDAPGAKEAWSKPAAVIALWILVEYFFVTNALQPSSRLRATALRAFGAKIGNGVILRPRLRVKFPWNLEIGDNCWIGEGVWIHNQDKVTIGHDVCISQESFLTTGSHAYRKNMALLSKPIEIEAGVWITSRCLILGGTKIGTSCLISPMSVVSGVLPPGKVWGSLTSIDLGERFEQ
jgi:putative colanic acid biosynthesis acetyltransferase WcaF